ncbi:hypothetical protein EV127DRAFT_470332 [Xylaria flabelliformis]|nr:hypothetical protein EV127DRAFT_470332 [Xylaria flabelliformis]
MACKKRAWRLLARIQYTASACKMVRAESCMRGPLSTLAICSKFHRVQVHTYMEDAYTFASKCKISHIVALHTQMSTTLPASGKGKRLIEFRCEVTWAGKHLLLESGTGMSVDIILWSRSGSGKLGPQLTSHIACHDVMTMLAHNTRTLPPLSSDSRRWTGLIAEYYGSLLNGSATYRDNLEQVEVLDIIPSLRCDCKMNLLGWATEPGFMWISDGRDVESPD